MKENGITMLQVLDKVVEFEMLVSDIYMKFSNIFKEDKDIWWQLSLEEKGHGSIARSGKEVFAPNDVFPEQLTLLPVENLNEALNEKKLLLEYINENEKKLTRAEAFEIAIKIETNDVEKIFQTLMDKFPENKAESVFQTLNKDCADHAKRLKEYARKEGLLD
jgi:rubrerythrin